VTGSARDASKSPKGGDPWKSPKAGAAKLYYADRRTLSDAAVAALVTAEDRQRVAPTMHARRVAEYLAGRALLRHALARYIGRSAASFRIETSADGKPSCVDGPALSLSHSGHIVVCAIAESGTLGVDVETGKPRALATIAERFFTPAEARWLAAEPVPRFRMLWVLKEAYLKAVGVGLAGGLSSLECRIEPPSIVAQVPDGVAAPQLALLQGSACCVGVASLAGPRLELVQEHVALDGSADAVGPLELLATT
jgi:4'-phosphopantetheinyl transferase